jgi:hypothetical protein
MKEHRRLTKNPQIQTRRLPRRRYKLPIPGPRSCYAGHAGCEEECAGLYILGSNGRIPFAMVIVVTRQNINETSLEAARRYKVFETCSGQESSPANVQQGGRDQARHKSSRRKHITVPNFYAYRAPKPKPKLTLFEPRS